MIAANLALVCQEHAVPKDMPPLAISRWINGTEPKKLEAYRGKVVLIVTTPTFCCGFDACVKAANDALRAYPRDLVVIGIFEGKLDADQTKELDAIRSSVKIPWPIAHDAERSVTSRMFPGEMPHYTFTFLDKQGRRRNIVCFHTDVVATVGKLVKE